MLNVRASIMIVSVCIAVPLWVDAKSSGHVRAQSAPESWTLVQVPGLWKQQADGHFAKYEGFAWYRCFVKVPDGWVASDKPELFSESVSLRIDDISQVYEVYVNGIKIGGAGSLPPAFQSAAGAMHRFNVPFKTLKKGQYNVLAIRVYGRDGLGGFLGRAPVLAGYFDEAALKGEWEFRTGDDMTWATAVVAVKPKFAVFEEFTDATTPLVRPAKLTPGKHLSPKEAGKSMRPMNGLVVDQVFTEPLVAQPMALHFDERGRLWVVQYRQYPFPAGLKMVSRDKYYRAVYDKTPLPPPHHDRGVDRITIHEDTHGEGHYDKHTTFLDGLNLATSVCRGRGGMWVAHSPYLLFYPDANNDDVPDGDPIVHLEGFGLQDTHSVVNSLHWGPDGWLYGMHGSTISSSVKVRGSTVPPVYCEGPAVWRYHPETKRFEIFAEGGGNPFCLEFDAQGRLYSGHNGSNTRGFHYLQGGIYLKVVENGFGKFGSLSNPYAFGSLPVMAHAPTPRFSHAIIRYEATALPEAYRGKLMAVDPLRRNVILAEMQPHGSTFQTKDVNFPLESSDGSFRPVEIKVGPDGWVYVADFCEEFIAHGQHFSGQIDPSTGRIYRLRTTHGAFARPFDLSKCSAAELVGLLSHADKWYRQTALRLLADRQDKSVLPKLLEMLEADAGHPALEALWAVHALGGLDDALAGKTLSHSISQVRLWTVRFLGDTRQVSAAMSKNLVALASKEPDVEVRAQLACTAKRLPVETCLGIIQGLLQFDEDAKDPCIPQLLWWAIESKASSDRDAVLALLRRPELWRYPIAQEIILPRLMRRYAMEGSRTDLRTCAMIFELAPDRAMQERLMTGFELAFKGRPVSGLPPELVAALSRVGGGSLAFRLRTGDTKAIDEALLAVASDQTNRIRRMEYIETLGEVREPRSLSVLLQLLESSRDEALQCAILVALQNHVDETIGTAVVKQLTDFPADARTVAISLLTSRKAWSRMLVEAVEAGTVKANAIPRDAVRQLALHRDEHLATLVAKHWKNQVGPTSNEMKQQIDRFAKVIQNGTGNPYVGRKLYMETCAKCHTLFGEGGRIGPDLTAQNRSDTQALLLSIINPSAEIREGFESYAVTTLDGRVVTGFIQDQDTKVVVLRGADGQNATIARDQIEELQRQPKSLMPDGLLDKLSDQQVQDLFAYLRSGQPISK